MERVFYIIMGSIISYVLWNKLGVLEDILRGPSRYFPDEVLLQILSKLPAKSVLRCRCVCQRWKALTSTGELALLHIKHSVPMVILKAEDEGLKELYMVDTCEASQTTPTTTIENGCCRISVNSVRPVSKSDRQEFLYSSNGLVIFQEEFRKSNSGLEHYVLLNPITREKVRLITPKGLIYGIFSNPFAKDQYCLLWGGRHLRQNGSMAFRILVLDGSKSVKSGVQKKLCCWRELYEDDDAQFSYQPRAQTPPIMVDDILYWMIGNRYAIARQSSPSSSALLPGTRLAPRCAESIMALDTKTEKFSVMPHPGPQDEYCKDDPEHSRMHLVEMDNHGFLCLCESSLFEESINIWILKQQDDDDGPLWIRWHRVNIHLDVSHFPFTSRSPNYNVRPVVIVDGELFLEWPTRGLFALNFKKMDISTSVEKKFIRRIESGFINATSMYAHTPSFVPLSNCEPETLMST